MPLPQLLPLDPYFAEEAAFHEHAAAEAQFWTNDGERGLKVIVPVLGYEFSNGQFVGSDPGGMFSYNKLSDIPIHGPSNFKVTTRGTGAGTYVTVVFYHDNNEPFGRFVGADPNQLARESGLVDLIGVGNWTHPGIGSTDAIFLKARGTNAAQIKGGASKWIADFELPEAFKDKAIEVEGNLRHHDALRIMRGHYVRWTSDHLIFFEDDVSSVNYTAYFMAHEDAHLTQLMPAGNQDVIVGGVQWTPPRFQ